MLGFEDMTCEQFSQLKKEELIAIAEQEEVELEKANTANVFFGYMWMFFTISPPTLLSLQNPVERSVKLVWSEACQETLVQIKDILPSRPGLKVPDLRPLFALTVDVGDVGVWVWVVLPQSDEDGCKRKVAYYSTKLHKCQQAYSTIEVYVISGYKIR